MSYRRNHRSQNAELCYGWWLSDTTVRYIEFLEITLVVKPPAARRRKYVKRPLTKTNKTSAVITSPDGNPVNVMLIG